MNAGKTLHCHYKVGVGEIDFVQNFAHLFTAT